MKTIKFTIVAIFYLIGLLHFQETKTLYKTIDSKNIYNINDKKVYVFTSGFMIDADGAPKAYHKDSSIALDYLANGGKPGNWWALATDNQKNSGNPLVQKATDPAPGYYISKTALEDRTKDYSDPLRYVNSSAIPYIALPSKFATDFKLGDIALVVNKKNNKKCYAIFADIGPKNKIGEGSIYLADQLGIKSSPKNGGTTKDVVYILFKSSGKGVVQTLTNINKIGRSRLTDNEISNLVIE
jgi:hypothetical protein